MHPFRMGIIGTGLIVQESHLPACLAAPGVSVTALMDSAPGRAAACAAKFGLDARTVSAVREMAGHVDGAIIATPERSHASIAAECLAAGIPVLIEKPLAPTNEECEQIKQASVRSGATVAVGYCLSFWPSVGFVRDLIAAGTFGATRRFVMQVGSAGGWSPLSAYYLQDRRNGAMSINGSHYLERALDWFGEPSEVAYQDDSEGGPEANGTATLGYGEFSGIVRVSRTTKLRPGCAIETDAGVLVHRDWQAPCVEFVPHGQADAAFVAAAGGLSITGRPDPFLRQIIDFVESCRSGRPPKVGIARGAAVTRLINRLYDCRRPLQSDWYATPAMGGSRS